MRKLTTKIAGAISIAMTAFAASAQANQTKLSIDGKPVLVLEAPAAAKISSTNGYINVRTTNMSLHVWAVPNARTAVDAVTRVGDLIKSEFVKFKPATTRNLVIAGAPALRVTGPGNEADDGDPGNAEVVLFVIGGRVFAGCVHGEFDDASRALAPMMAALSTARLPP